jgi:hypothetical protein
MHQLESRAHVVDPAAERQAEPRRDLAGAFQRSASGTLVASCCRREDWYAWLAEIAAAIESRQPRAETRKPERRLAQGAVTAGKERFADAFGLIPPRRRASRGQDQRTTGTARGRAPGSADAAAQGRLAPPAHAGLMILTTEKR